MLYLSSELQSYFLLVLGVFEMALTSVELTPLQNSILKLGCLATSTILNCGSHDPLFRHNFLFFLARRPRLASFMPVGLSSSRQQCSSCRPALALGHIRGDLI
jgi:hypothetical protein